MQENIILATVGTRQITLNDVNALMQSLDPQAAKQFATEEGKRNLVSELANQELFYLDAIDKGYDSEEEYKAEVEKMKDSILKKYALEKLLSGLKVSENEIEAFYFSNKNQFAEPESIKASHILVDEADKAKEILEEINSGLSFENAAHEYSVCPSKDEGGDLGYFSRGRMVPEFENAAFETQPGQITGPIKSPFGYHIIKVTDRKKPGVKHLSEVKDQIYNMLLSKKQEDLFYTKVSQLKQKYEIKINL
jgi:peptidyl-prolyl cis-trans isomerase C